MGSPFILFVSTIERRKNHETLYKAYHLLCRAGLKDKLPKLVFVGMPGWGVGDFLKDLELDPLIQGLVVQFNHVNDAELLELYKESLFCVYPSLYEGWGLPVGEALSLGKVVLSSDQGSLPEVGGDLVRYVPAWDPQAWADAILELTMHETELDRLAVKVRSDYRTRTWLDTAKAVAEVVDLLAAEPETNLSLFAGYDFSTQCGLHAGSKIRATGEPGVLLHGPYLSLRPGKYSIEVHLSRKNIAKNSVMFDVTTELGQVTHAKEWLQPMHCAEQDCPDDHTLRFEIDLDKYVDDLEVRCFSERGNLFDIGWIDISN